MNTAQTQLNDPSVTIVVFIEEITDEKLSGITLLYGAAGVGKTTACLEAIAGRCVYVTSNKNFSVERLRSMNSVVDAVLSKLVLFEPGDLTEWERAVEQAVELSQLSSVIIIDSMATPLRSAPRTLGNLALHRMLENLKKAKCPVIMTTEIYDVPQKGPKNEISFVGGDMLRLAARTIIELRNGAAIVRKHPLVVGRTWDYRIAAAGLEKI